MTFRMIGTRLHRDGEPVPLAPTPNVGGRMSPDMIVVHDTAGRLTPGSSVSWLVNPKARASAHFVIERDGSVTQLAETDRQTWHAGKSSWEGVSGVNRRAIGIEMVGPGKLVKSGDSCAAWFGEKYSIAEYGIQEATTSAHGHGWWMPNTEAQIAACGALCAVLADKYSITPDHIVGHWQISPARKVDPCPLFDLHALRGALEKLPEPPGEFLLSVGSRGPDVVTAQLRLKVLGYDLGPAGSDGKFGTKTRNAVLAWEAEQGRPTNGAIDKLDFAALTSDQAKEMPESPVAAEVAEKKEAAAKTVDVASALAVTGSVLSAGVPDSAWGALMSGIDRLSEAVGKFAGLGVKVPASFIVPMICVFAILAVWRWHRQATGAKP